ncbi:ParB/RepB/Spo0J family partition protein [Blastococcus capsensis]|uniref:ParB/RepB/Spo0J family partition protein n=1 Tax=Blastococcus capsensis TaxID=1564163 RepID=UPI0025414A93|nr:ParB N-terminal domain-containing protein [Blastococcus capsensis]MDK3255267.1 ParB N-terminal domain-containing protein [Blastococcus capsensis]
MTSTLPYGGDADAGSLPFGGASAPSADDKAGHPAPAEDPVQQLVWLDPSTLTIHPRNIRDDLSDLSGLATSIAAQGVLEALTVVPHAKGDGTIGHLLVAGHRRAAAALLAGVPSVPCVVRPDLAAEPDDLAGQARHVGAMLAENLHRAALTAVEEARGVQTMLDLGDSLTEVARSTGLGRNRVTKAAGVARLPADTAAAVSAAGLTLDQAAAVAVYADDAETTAALIAAAGEGAGQFAHALTRAKRARQEVEKIAVLSADLTAAGRTLLDAAEGRGQTRISQLAHDGEFLTAEVHASCPGSAVYIATAWNGPQAVEVCTNPAAFGHAGRYSGDPIPNTQLAEEERDATDERRITIVNNREMAAANETRREWVRAFLMRKSVPRAALRFAVETMASDPRVLARWLSGQSNLAQDAASADLGIEAPGLWRTTKGELTLTSGKLVPDGRLPIVLLAHVAGAIETAMHRGTWRDPRATDARWLRFLAGYGYSLAEIEQRIVDGIDERTSSDDFAPHDNDAASDPDDNGAPEAC